MQTHGHLIIDNQKILVLVRHKKYGCAIKKRLTGTDGTFFEDESCFLSLEENKEMLDELLVGVVIDV